MKIVSKKNVALLELIIVLLFFALSSVILAQVFVKAESMNETSRAETLGLTVAQDLVERLKSAPWDAQSILSEKDGWTHEPDGAFAAAYGTDLRPSSDDPVYTVHAKITPVQKTAGVLYDITVGIDRMSDGKNIVQLETARYTSDNEEVSR